MIAAIGYAAYRVLAEERPGPVSTRSRPEVEDRITLIGATSAGKSHLGNVLLGEDVFATSPEHGTTIESASAYDSQDREIVDTPGLLDGEESRAEARDAALRSRVVVYVTNGELYRPEKEFLTELAQEMSPGAHKLILYLSKHDVRLATMPGEMRAKVQRRLKSQMNTFRKNAAFYGVKLIGPVVGGVGHYDAIFAAIEKAFDDA